MYSGGVSAVSDAWAAMFGRFLRRGILSPDDAAWITPILGLPGFVPPA